MKHTKKFLSLLLSLVLALSCTSGFTAKAASNETLTVTLRVEQDASTILPPVVITLNESDKKDYGIGLSTETLTPLHALAKYLQTEKKVSDEKMKDYITQSAGWVTNIKVNDTDNGTPSSIQQSETSWMFAINNKASMVNEKASEENGYTTSYSSFDYPLSDKDSIVFYGVWYGIYGEIDSYYSTFEKDSYETIQGTPLTIHLKQCGIYDASGIPANNGAATATIIASKDGSPTPDKYELKGTTDKDGKVSLTFPSSGTYTLSAYREINVENEDGTKTTHYDLSRPYAVVNVKERIPDFICPPPSHDFDKKPVTTVTLKKPAKVKKLKVKVKKSKKAKKTVTVSWKKVSSAAGYQIYVKKSAKKNAKKTPKYIKKATVKKKTKTTIKLTKGTYSIKVRAYNKANSKVKYGTFSKIVKVKIK